MFCEAVKELLVEKAIVSKEHVLFGKPGSCLTKNTEMEEAIKNEMIG